MELNTTNSGIIQNPDTINLKTNQDVNVNTTSQNIEFLGIPYGLSNITQQPHILSLDIPESTLRNTLENLISEENVNSLRSYFLERFSNNTGSTNPINERLDYDPDWELEYENSDENGENSDENGENSDENNSVSGEDTVTSVKLNVKTDGEEIVHNSDENNDNDENGGGNEHIGGNSGGNDENSGSNYK